jgi:hypothetical protein
MTPPISRREIASITAALAFISLVILPVFTAGLACSDDTLPHFYRTVQLLVLAGQGSPFLQWGPDLLRGYGYPIMAFYAPLTYWLLAGIQAIGLTLGQAMQIAFLGALVAAGLGAYILARRYMGPVGALTAGVAYLFSPYLLYDAIQRGALPETLALALMPWALAAADRVQARPSWRAIGLGALLFALLILLHNVLPLFGLALAGLWALLPLRPVADGRDWLRQVWLVWLMLALALGLTLFFWLPGLAELPYTQSRRDDPILHDWPRFEQHLVPLNQLVGWPDEAPDPRLLNPPVSRTLGAGQTALGLLAVWGIWAYPSGRRRRRLWLLAGLTAVSIFFTTQASYGWWAHIGPLNFIQLPTRFLGPASLGLALLSGVAVDALWQRLRPRPVQVGIALLAGTAVALSGWPWLYPQYCPVPQAPDQVALAQATTWLRWYAEAQGELLPRWVDALPPEDGLIPQYQTGGPVNRLALPPETTLRHWETGPGWDRYDLVTPTAVTLTYHTFYFPGWQAKLDDTAVPITITAPEGLMAVSLPAGEHHLEIAFRATPVRRVALWASLLFVLAALTLVALNPRWREAKPPMAAAATWPGAGIVFLALALLLPALKAGFDFVLTRQQRQAVAEQPLAIDFSGEMTYLGYNGPETVAADQPFTITQYWSPQREIGVPYGFALYVTDDQGRVWQQPVARPFGYTHYPSDRGWQVGSYARDAYEINLLPGTPPGLYWLEVEGFRRDAAVSLLPRNWPTGPNPARARVGQVQITSGDWALTADNATVDTFAPTPIAAQPGLTLLGWTLPARPWRPGDVAELDLLWQSEVVGERPLPITLDLYDDAGMVVAQQAVTPGAVGIVRDKVQWRLPAELVTGHYVVNLTAGEQTFALGEWQIDAPEHRFDAPDVAQTAVFTVPFASLMGYNGWGTAVGPGDTLELELVWQVLATADTSYRVFVHLLDEAGNLVAQSDAVPDHWTRPTTGWLSGEYIRDRHTLPLPPDAAPGNYTLRLGWYDPATGERPGSAIIGAVQVTGE